MGGLVGLSLCASGRGPLTAADPAAKPANSTSIVTFENARLLFVDRHEVAFDRPGVLKFVVEEGETVTQGQVVAQQEDSIARAAVGVAEARVMNTAEIESAKLQAELAEMKYQVAKQKSDEYNKKVPTLTPESQPTAPTPVLESPPSPTVQSDELYPKVYIDELRLTAASAKSEIGRFEKEHEVNQQGLLQAKAELEVLQLKAPRNGLVTRAYKQTGEGAQSGEKILEIISTQRIRAEVDVSAIAAARLKVGLPIIVIVEQPTGETAMSVERYSTTLKFIDPTITQIGQKVRIWAELDNSHGKLREGLKATIEIVPSSVPPATSPQ
jgi:multidrug efflux pump subunit AcrA (membrane-fusion protein)